MSPFRYALGRLWGGLLALCLFALFLNALILSQQHWTYSAVALSGPPPAQVALGRFVQDRASDRAPGRTGDEVNLTARIDAALDVALPTGTAKLYLLADPAAALNSAALGAIFVAPSDTAAFETYLAAATQASVGDAPVIALTGVLAVPFWIDRADAAAAEAKRALAPGAPFVRPFLHGRAAGLAPPLLSYLVPLGLLVLLLAHLWSEARRVLTHRQTLRALAGLSALDRDAEETAAMSGALQPGDRQWGEIAARRHSLRQRRTQLDTLLAQAVQGGTARGVWLMAAALGGLAGILPQRPLFDALASHLAGRDLTGFFAFANGAAWYARVDAALALPGEGLARLVVAVFGPQAVGVASGFRTLPDTVWLAFGFVIVLAVLRRALATRARQARMP